MRVSAETKAALNGLRDPASSLDAIIRQLVEGKMYTPSPVDRLAPELRPVAAQLLESLREIPRDLALASIAVVYLRTLPEARRLQLVTMVLEHVLDPQPDVDTGAYAPPGATIAPPVDG